MNEEFQHEESTPPAPAEQDLVRLLQRIEQKLTFLEKKLDSLLVQSQTRPSGERHFSKPFRSYGPPHRRPEGREYGDAPRERNFEPRGHFGKPRHEEGRGFEHKKKSYDAPREGGFSRDSRQPRFEKRRDSEGRGFGGGHKKPFPFKRRHRN